MVLITGSNGFVGRELLKSKDIFFKKVLRTNSVQSSRNTFCISEFSEDTNWHGAFIDCSCVIHLAAVAHTSDSSDFYSVNTKGTMHFAECAAVAGVKRFVFISTVGVFGSYSKSVPFSNNSQINPHNNYSNSKVLAEEYLLRIGKKYNMEIVIIRSPAVYGIDCPGSFSRLFKVIKSFNLLPFRFVENRRDFIYVKNLVDVILNCVQNQNAADQTFLVSDDHTISIKDFTTMYSNALGIPLFQLPIPISLLKLSFRLLGLNHFNDQLLSNFEIDISHTKKVLDWKPPFSINDAFKDMSKSS